VHGQNLRILTRRRNRGLAAEALKRLRPSWALRWPAKALAGTQTRYPTLRLFFASRLILASALACRRGRHLDPKNARLPSSLSEEELAKRRKFFDSVLTMPPEIAGEIIVRGVENRKPRILVGRDAKYAALVERLMPVTYWNWLGPGAKQ
jgi:hypothetical protein